MSTSSVSIVGVDNTDTVLTLTGTAVSIGNATISGTNTGDQTSVTGNAGTSTKANDTTNSSYYITFASAATGSLADLTNASIRVNPSTANISATTFTGALVGNVTGNVSGNAATVTTNANLTGDITSSGNATTAAAALITARTEDTTPDSAADYILTYDASATALKKVLIQNMPAGTPTPQHGLTYVLATNTFCA